ncbi:MAG: dephospho-CoA kinase [Synergistaceae bacterium]|jgi:dephospho-CoA kinase|nr:dephospho-CoA kinase [Synergistaceae bacterium]
MFTVALTGEVGSGKSSIARVWGQMGANVIKADAVAKEQWRRPEIMRAAKERWGEGVFKGGEPDHRRIAEMAFKDNTENAFTNGLIHPGTIAEITRTVREARGWIVLEVPLLFESGRFDYVDCIICVTAPDDLKAERNLARGWTEGEIGRRERFMTNTAKKQAMSDMVLLNAGSMESWEARARELGALMLKMSAVYELTTYCGNEGEARNIASALVNERLAASVNVNRADSCFRWRGRVHWEDEWALRCMTTESVMRRAIARVTRLHSYELPGITALEVCHSNFDTLKWVVECCEPE